MKRVFLFLAVFCFAVFSTSCPYPHPHPFPYGGKKAVVYLHILKEDGSPLEDSYADNFKLDYSEKSYSKDIMTIINEKDELIFLCSEFYVNYEGENPTEDDMKKALDNEYWFALKDTKGVYRTVKKTYKDTYKRYEKNPIQGYFYDINYIYHCEIKLEKK